jgi:hypothetical protein
MKRKRTIHDEFNWIRWLPLYMILVVVGVIAIVAEAQLEQAQCYQFPPAWVYEDITDEYTLIYDLWYSGIEENKSEALRRVADYNAIRHIGRYEVEGYWLEVFLSENIDNGDDNREFLVYIGDDWTIGDDGALHSPCSIVILHRFDSRLYTRIYQR